MKFTAVWPVLGVLHQTRPCRILPHVIPFLRVALAATQQMVKEALLPERRSMSRASPMLGHELFQAAHPAGQCLGVLSGHKDVQVVGHQHIAPNPHLSSLRRYLAKGHEDLVRLSVRKHRLALMGAAGNEEQGAALREDAGETPQPLWPVPTVVLVFISHAIPRRLAKPAYSKQNHDSAINSRSRYSATVQNVRKAKNPPVSGSGACHWSIFLPLM